MEQSPFERLTVIQRVKKLLAFMESEVSLPSSQCPVTSRYPAPNEFSSHLHTL